MLSTFRKLIEKFENGDISAKDVQEKLKEFNDGQNIDVSMLPTGLYNLVVENRDGSIKANGLKIIKQ